MKKIVLVMMLLATLMQSSVLAKEKQKEVKFGVYITNLFDINFSKNEYTVEFWSWFLHNDNNYKPNVTAEILNAKKYSKKMVNEEVVKGVNWDTAKVTATIKEQWDVKHYPFDVQKFSIVIEDVNNQAKDLIFKPDLLASKIDPNAIPDGWKLKKFEVTSSINSYATAFGDPSAKTDAHEEYSRLNVDVYLQRNGWRLFSTSFIGFFVATALLFITFVVISIPRAVAEIPQQPRITLITGALFSAVASVYGLSSQLPYTTVFTLADSLQITTFIGVAFAAIGSISSDVLNKNGRPVLAARSNQVMFLLFLLLSFGLNGYMLAKALA